MSENASMINKGSPKFLMAWSVCCLCCLAIVLLLTFPDIISAEERAGERIFQGTIGERLKIELRLQHTDPISGSYSYDKIGKAIRLQSKPDENSKLVMAEFDEKGNKTGQFNGDLFGRVFSGVWSSVDGKRSYPYFLVETTRKWQGSLLYRSSTPLLARAKKGDSDAQYRLGRLYQYGQGSLPYDINKALDWYRRAADQQHAAALYALGKLHLNGQGVQRDFEEAKYLFERAAKAGHQESKSWLDYEFKNSFVRKSHVKQQEDRGTQYFVDLASADSRGAEAALIKLDTPEAKAYLAYLYYAGKVKKEQLRDIVNLLFTKANEQLENKQELNNLGVPGEIDNLSSLEEDKALLSNIRVLTDSINVPCFVFMDYPEAALKAFGSVFGGSRDSSPDVCSQSPVLEGVPALSEYRKALDKVYPVNEESQEVGTIRFAYGRGDQMEELQRNLVPQVGEAEYPGDAETYANEAMDEASRKIPKVHKRALSDLERFYFEEFLFTKEAAKTLSRSYVRSLARSARSWADLYNDSDH